MPIFYLSLIVFKEDLICIGDQFCIRQFGEIEKHALLNVLCCQFLFFGFTQFFARFKNFLHGYSYSPRSFDRTLITRITRIHTDH